MSQTDSASTTTSAWPLSGRPGSDVLADVTRLAEESGFDDYPQNLFEEGPHLTSTPSLPAGDEIRDVVYDAYRHFIHGENWYTGAGARIMERDIIGMMGEVFHHPSPTPLGRVTSGGTESNTVGLVTAKAMAFRKLYAAVDEPGWPHEIGEETRALLSDFHRRPKSIVLPAHSHYSFFKAAAVLGLNTIIVPSVPGTFAQVDVDAVRAAVRDDTIALVGTAGVWPYGTIDPIEQLGEIAEEFDLHLHVDSCFGGFLIPFLERAGYYPDELPAYDFRVDRVMTMTADAHKNGMVPKPSSTVYWRNEEVFEAAKLFLPPDGLMSGTRGTGPIAATWAMMQSLGLEGYQRVALQSIRLRDELVAGLESIPGLKVTQGSLINLTTVYSDELDLRPVFEAVSSKGWRIVHEDRIKPVCLEIVTMPQNFGQIEDFVKALAEAVETAAVPLGTLPDDVAMQAYGLDFD